MSAAPTAQDLTALAVRLASVTGRVESRLGQVSEQTLSASQAMVRQAHDAQKVVDAAGKLAPCPEGGLCAMVDKRSTRIDKQRGAAIARNA